MAEHNDLGTWGEKLAADYLIRQGYTIKERDWRYNHRDLDLIALTEDNTMLVIVEVKTRRGEGPLQPQQAVDKRKIRNLAYAANDYIHLNNVENDVRFDIISVIGTSRENAVIEHIKDAFNPLLL